MKIKSLKLSGYKRFSLSNINNFTIDADSDIQVIIGTNGSGKSSLLEALSPYPQAKSEFIKGGSKELIIEHNNSEFRLLSFYKGSGKHQFIKNGMELNEGGTASVQKELVERELGFTSQLHNLLTGEDSFTSMSPMQRREWIMRISNLDLTFAMDKYNQIRGLLRDAQGALKHTQVRLGRESQRLLSEMDLTDLIKESETLQKHIQFYMKELKNDLPNLILIEKYYDNLSNEIESLSMEIIKSKFSYVKKSEYPRLDLIINRENELMAKDKSLRAVLVELENQLKESNEILEQLRKTGLNNKTQLIAKLETLKTKRINVDFQFEVEGELDAILKDSKSVRMSLIELVSEAKGDSINVPEKGQWSKLRETLNEVTLKLQSKDNKLLKTLKRLEVIENSYESTCPKCKYIWKPGVSEKEITQLKSTADNLKKEIAILKVNIATLTKTCNCISIREDEINRFRTLSHNYPRLRNFWLFIAEKRYLHDSPREINICFNQWVKELEQRIEIDNLDIEIQNVEKTLDRLDSESKGADIDYFTKRELQLSEKIGLILSELEFNVNEISELQKYKKDYMGIADKTSTLVKKIEELKKLEFQILEGTIQKEVKERLEISQLTLASNRKKQSEAETLNGIVEDLKKDIERLKVDIKSLTALEKAMSPNDGLIADSLVGFIDNFINQLNQIISEVWEYDMRLMPCANANGVLDFRFPLKTVGNEEPIYDIAKGSTGQKEIIDFVFTLAVMAYLDLKDFPLFLDELGNTFDKTHKSKLVIFIKELLERGHCSQVWMISHYAADHGGLKNAQVCVMDASNVAAPEGSNNHVTMS